ncbi:hypothetical protein V3C33_16740 [Micrococcaceae bacterium Sec5.7]
MAIDQKYVTYAVAALAIAAAPLSFFGPQGLRLAVIGLLMLAGPGTALVLFLRFGPPGSPRASGTFPLAVAIAVASSLALSTVVATAMIYARIWSPPAAVCLLSLITLGLLALGVKRSRETLAGAK